MKLHCPQVTWHGGENGKNAPILSLDFHPFDRHLIVTSGSDAEARIWLIESDSDVPRFLFSLTGHESSINCVRWSPDGNAVASGSDGGTIIWWTLPEREDHLSSREKWRNLVDDKDLRKRIVKQHEDVYDISWSPSGHQLACGSVNHITYLWDLEKSRMIGQLREHSHFVQGVAWDPHGVLLATQSSDRTVKIFAAKEEKSSKRKASQGRPLPGWTPDGVVDRCQRTIKYLNAPSPAVTESGNTAALSQANEASRLLSLESNSTTEADSQPKKLRGKAMFADEAVPSFFRRLDWTPDGAFLIAPAGIYSTPTNDDTAKQTEFTSWVFSRSQLDSPICALPGLDKPSVAVRCSRRLYEPRTSCTSESWSDLPHRCLFAVLTLNSVLVYDTQQVEPIAVANHIHYSSLTDATWSADGKCLAVSSSDGYVSIIRFGNEIGDTLERASVNAWLPKNRFAQPKPKTVVPTLVVPSAKQPPVVTQANPIAESVQSQALTPQASSDVPSKKRRITPELVVRSPPSSASLKKVETPSNPPNNLLVSPPPVAPAASDSSGGDVVAAAAGNPLMEEIVSQVEQVQAEVAPKKVKKRATLIFVRQ